MVDEEKDSWTYRDQIFARTRERLVTRKSQEWIELFLKNDIWAGPVYGYEEVLNDPQIAHNGTFVEYDHPSEGHVKMPGFPIRFSKTPSEHHARCAADWRAHARCPARGGLRGGQDQQPHQQWRGEAGLTRICDALSRPDLGSSSRL